MKLNHAIRRHCQAVFNWLGGLKVSYGTIKGVEKNNLEILRIFSPPMRAFAEMRDVLIRRGWLPDTPLPEGENPIRTVPLPFVSITYRLPTIDFNRQLNALGGFPSLVQLSDGTTLSYPFPKPWDIPFTLDFWCRTTSVMTLLTEWFQNQVGKVGAGPDEVMIPVDFQDPWGTKIIPFRLESLDDTSELEGFDNVERTRRFTVNGTMRGWLFPNARKLSAPWTDEDESLSVTGRSKPVLNGAQEYFDPTLNGLSLESRMGQSHNLIREGKLDLYHSSTSGASVEDGPPFKLTFATDSDTVNTGLLPPVFGVLHLHGEVESNTTGSSIPVSIVDLDENLIESFQIEEGKFEHFAYVPDTFNGFGVVFGAASAGSYVFREIGIYPRSGKLGSPTYGPETLDATDTPAGDEISVTLPVSKSTEPYLLSATVLTLTGRFAILLEDDSVSPVFTESVYLEPGEKETFAILLQPKFKATEMRLRIVNESGGVATAILSNVQLREYKDVIYGNRVN